MIRQPTPIDDQLAWWRRALGDPKTPRHEGDPQPGYYRARMVKGGPFVPVRIWLDQSIDENGELTAPEELRAERNGWPVDPISAWLSCRAIPRDEFDALVEAHQRDDIMAATHAPINLAKTPILPGGN